MAVKVGTQRARLAAMIGRPIADHAPAGDIGLAGLLDALGPERATSIRSRLAGEYSHRVLQAYRKAFAQGKREISFLCSESLAVRRSTPPCFRLDGADGAAHGDDEYKFDLLAHDLQWIAATYPEHWLRAKGSYGRLLHGDSWLREAEHLWVTRHRGETWLIVRQLSLTVEQQWECSTLRSMPIKRAAQGLNYRRRTVHRAIMAQLPSATKRRHEGEAMLTLNRRFRVWVCGEMTGHSPTKAARLYGLWTGNEIARSVVDRDLAWVHRHIPESRKNRHAESVQINMGEDTQ